MQKVKQKQTNKDNVYDCPICFRGKKFFKQDKDDQILENFIDFKPFIYNSRLFIDENAKNNNPNKKQQVSDIQQVPIFIPFIIKNHT
jgi:hypothetical protein